MILFVYILFISVAFGAKEPTGKDAVVVQTTIDELTDRSIIDVVWIDYMITAPATINLLGQVMVVGSEVDVSFERYSPNRTYKYIKYPKSFRGTLLQISNEGYRAFLNAHSAMNRIQLYMKQIPEHMNTMVKALSSKVSGKLVGRILLLSTNNIERIGNVCVSLATDAKDSFNSVINLLEEVIEITQVTGSLHGEETRRAKAELNIVRQMHADMVREEQMHRQHYEEVRQNIHNAQEEYSQAMKEIPTGFKIVGLDLGRAVISTLKELAIFGITMKMGIFSLLKQPFVPIGRVPTFATNQIINLVSCFSKSLHKLITKFSCNNHRTINGNELKSYNVVFKVFNNMINYFPNTKLKTKASEFVQQAIISVDRLMTDKTLNITNSLQTLANNIIPFMAASQISSRNTAPISVPRKDDSSHNELLRARLAQDRLIHIENRLDQYAAIHALAVEKVHELSAKLARIDLIVIDFKQILKMLNALFKLLGHLRSKWHEFILFFTDFSAQIVAGFDEKIKKFIESTGLDDKLEQLDVDRTLILELLNGNSTSLYHQSYLLYILSRTYYDVSSKYFMPSISGLSLMLTASNHSERNSLFRKLQKDTKKVQLDVEKIVKKNKEHYKKLISGKRAKLNEKIDELGEDGNEQDIIEQGKKLLDYENDTDQNEHLNKKEENEEYATDKEK